MAKKRPTVKQKAFLAAYAQKGCITYAASAAPCSRSLHYTWLETDPAYRILFDSAHQQACEALESEARSRAVDGVKRLKFSANGAPVIDPQTGEQYAENHYSDTLLIFLMKGAMPEKYRERHEVSGPGGGPLEISHALRQAAILDPDVSDSLCDALDGLSLDGGDISNDSSGNKPASGTPGGDGNTGGSCADSQ